MRDILWGLGYGLSLFSLCAAITASIMFITNSGPFTPPEPPRYVIGGQAPARELMYLITVPCSERPAGWTQARAVCNLDALLAVKVDADTYMAYNVGDAYPAVSP